MGIHDIRDPAAIRAAMEEFDRVGRTYFLEKYGFGRSREYMIRDSQTGKLYDSKAIVGAAYGYAFPGAPRLEASHFSGGEATVLVLLEGLGFEVLRVGQDWTREEVEATVADYFEMLRMEATGRTYSKSEHNEHLRQKLRARSKGSIEMKHQNISAVLDQLGLPCIKGYKPRANYQELLREVVIAHVQSERQVLQTIVDAIEERTTPGARQYRGVLIDPPRPDVEPVMPSSQRKERLPRRLDYAARDEHNRALGQNGEEWVVGFEETRLTDAHRPELAAKIDWVSRRCGDGAGYDVLSFEENAIARFIGGCPEFCVNGVWIRGCSSVLRTGW